MQAARGTPLTDGDDQASPGDPARGRSHSSAPRRRLGLLLGVALTAYAADVLTKVLAVARLDPAERVPVLGPVLSLTLVRNPGAAFSTGTGFTVVLSFVAIAALGVALWLGRRVGSPLWAVGLGLLAGGVAGNLTDRLLRAPGVLEGHVVDFLALPN